MSFNSSRHNNISLIFCVYQILELSPWFLETYKNDNRNKNRNRFVYRLFLHFEYLTNCQQEFLGYTKYYLPAKNQEHLIISTWDGASQKIEFLGTKHLVSL